MDVSKVFWHASVQELTKGYFFDEVLQAYICLLCGSEFYKGVIYPGEQVFYEAEMAVKQHIERHHGSTLSYLLSMDKQYTGLTEQQQELLKLMGEGCNDQEMASRLGVGSNSTVRNHRFKLREKEKQAKVFLAIMALLKDHVHTEKDLVDIHRGAKMVDERFAITEQDQQHTFAHYFDAQGRLQKIPRKEKRKIVVLQHLVGKFSREQEYTETQVNDIIAETYHDYVTLRRYLIDYGFLDRSNDGSRYWVKP